MGLLDKFRRGGGGFLNGVDGTIVGLAFTTEPDFGNADYTPTGDNRPLWVKLTVRPDSSEKDETVHAQVAFNGDDFVITDDGYGFTPVGDAGFYLDSPFGQFYESYVANGGDDTDPQEDGTLDFSHLLTKRVRFVQVKDEAQMARIAESWKKNKGKTRKNFNAEGQKLSKKDKKYYDVKVLQVSAVYESPEDAMVRQLEQRGAIEKVAVPAASRPATTSPTRTNGSGKKAAPAPKPELPLYDTNDSRDALTTILNREKGHKIAKRSLTVAITRLFPDEPDKREYIRRDLYDDATLAGFVEEGIIAYAKSHKDQTISLVAA